MRLLLTGLLFGALLAPAAALADPSPSPPKAGVSKANAAKVTPAKENSVKPAGQVQAAAATASEPLYPRWISKSWKISGLTVWTFTPGHFQGQ